jgi:hypothetical protein
VQGFFSNLARSVLRLVRFFPRQELRRSKNDELPEGAEGEQQIACFIVASRQLCIAVSAETPTSVECFGRAGSIKQYCYELKMLEH